MVFLLSSVNFCPVSIRMYCSPAKAREYVINCVCLSVRLFLSSLVFEISFLKFCVTVDC